MLWIDIYFTNVSIFFYSTIKNPIRWFSIYILSSLNYLEGPLSVIITLFYFCKALTLGFICKTSSFLYFKLDCLCKGWYSFIRWSLILIVAASGNNRAVCVFYLILKLRTSILVWELISFSDKKKVISCLRLPFFNNPKNSIFLIYL